ncbi:hypothetical protein FBU30_001331 [Linnemannia zychae]|nr:hypothetical protein FBU30_001331 [Linnemannia zychae]
MSLTINSFSSPTNIDDLPQPQSDPSWPYGKLWRNRISCAQLQEMTNFPQFSSTRDMGELQCRTTLPAAVLTQESLAALKIIPNVQSYTATYNKFKNTNDQNLWINIGSTFGPFRVSKEIDFIS